MTLPILNALTFLAALGSGLIAGLFFAFSTSVMRALGSLPAAQGIAAMKAINVSILNLWFGLAFFGTAVVCAAVLILAALSRQTAGADWLIVGALLYLIGSLGVTMALNVPLNNALAATDPTSDQAETVWAGYLNDWTRWNHVRALASLAAAGCLTVGLC